MQAQSIMSKSRADFRFIVLKFLGLLCKRKVKVEINIDDGETMKIIDYKSKMIEEFQKFNGVVYFVLV